MFHLLSESNQAHWTRGGTEGPCSCSAPFDRIAEINFNVEADEDSVSDGLLQGGGASFYSPCSDSSDYAHNLVLVTDGWDHGGPGQYICVSGLGGIPPWELRAELPPFLLPYCLSALFCELSPSGSYLEPRLPQVL